jgi:hypothetical protein
MHQLFACSRMIHQRTSEAMRNAGKQPSAMPAIASVCRVPPVPQLSSLSQFCTSKRNKMDQLLHTKQLSPTMYYHQIPVAPQRSLPGWTHAMLFCSPVKLQHPSLFPSVLYNTRKYQCHPARLFRPCVRLTRSLFRLFPHSTNVHRCRCPPMQMCAECG